MRLVGPRGAFLLASWYRATAGRLRWGLSGRLNITYIGQ